MNMKIMMVMMMMMKHFAAEAAVVRRKQDWIGAEKLPAKETCSFATKRNYLMFGTKSILEDI